MVDLVSQFRARRPLVLASFDGLAWVVGFVLTAALGQLTTDGFPRSVQHATLVGLACGLLHYAVGRTVRLHEGRAQLGSFEDAILVTGIAAAVGIAALSAELAIGFWLGFWYRTLVAVAAPIFAAFLMLIGRGFYRAMREHTEVAPGARSGRTPVVVIGAGEGARQLVGAMLRDAGGRWSPVALVDDDPLKRHRRIRSVPWRGPTQDFARVAKTHGASTAIMAIPSASAVLVRQLNVIATEAGVTLKVLPSPGELLDPHGVAIKDIRDINVTDLLGRHQVDTDVASIAGYLTGKRVLVTGAGGSIGSELCRQIAKFNPSELIMFDRDESALHAVELSIYGKAMLDEDDTVLGDIRDTHFILDLFEDRRPHVVFHAAALKHLPLLEKAPGEAIKTNVWGTLTVLEAAAKSGVNQFVNISTDKAANPVSVLGFTKRLAEGLTAAIARDAEGTYISVRFGNVLGSRGSVLAAFAAQIAQGGPVTVTDPGVTRYFMTIQEAVQLVIQAAAIGGDGEALVLDMGKSISIEAVARQLIELSGEDIDVVYTGLRTGEKLHEELFAVGEPDDRPAHPLISHVKVPPYDRLAARSLDPWADLAEVRDSLRIACLEMHTGAGAGA